MATAPSVSEVITMTSSCRHNYFQVGEGAALAFFVPGWQKSQDHLWPCAFLIYTYQNSPTFLTENRQPSIVWRGEGMIIKQMWKRRISGLGSDMFLQRKLFSILFLKLFRFSKGFSRTPPTRPHVASTDWLEEKTVEDQHVMKVMVKPFIVTVLAFFKIVQSNSCWFYVLQCLRAQF